MIKYIGVEDNFTDSIRERLLESENVGITRLKLGRDVQYNELVGICRQCIHTD